MAHVRESADRIRRSLQGTEVEAKQPQSATSVSRQKRRLQFVPDLVSGANDEEVPRVQDSKARQTYLAGQYSGHDALPADCKCPWHKAMARP
jgi:hypothetical protein